MARVLVGVDLGSVYTKVVVLEAGVKTHLSEAFYFATPLRPGSVFAIDKEQLMARLRTHIPLARLKLSEIGVSLPNASLTALPVFLPPMSRKEAQFAAFNEARQKMIPVTAPNHVFESLLLKLPGQEKLSETLMFRTTRELVQDVLSAFGAVDIYPRIICPPSSTLPALLPKEAWKKHESVAFVDLGAGSLNISVSTLGSIVFMRNVMYGVKDIIQELSRELGMESAKTEEMLLELGVPDVPFDMKDKVALAEEIMRQKYEAGLDGATGAVEPAAKVNLLELRMMWEPHLERVVQELRRSFVFYKEQVESKRGDKVPKKIDKIYFLGGGFCLKNLIAVISPLVGVACEAFIPIKEEQHKLDLSHAHLDAVLSTPFFSVAEALATCAGLERGGKSNFVNFVPYELKQKELIAAKRIAVSLGMFGLTAIIAILGGHLYLNSQGLQEQIRQTNRKTAKVTVEANYLNAMEAQEKEVRRKKSLIEELNKKNPDVLSALTRFSGCVPEEVVLVKCELTPYSLNMQGRVTADFETASAIADSFKKCLERQSFRNVSITSLTLEQIVPQGAQETVALTGSKDRLFTLTAELGEPPVQAKAEKKSKKEQVEELMK